MIGVRIEKPMRVPFLFTEQFCKEEIDYFNLAEEDFKKLKDLKPPKDFSSFMRFINKLNTENKISINLFTYLIFKYNGTTTPRKTDTSKKTKD